ncbi:4Fe-4S dicluster domain-containing protein [bacterium]|nr:4Fe-4S dicluster domain-containing protein [bacterium]
MDEKLYTLKFVTDEDSHLKPNPESCRKCKSKICTVVCPANVYEWLATSDSLVVKYENCLECGACRIACEMKDLDWKYPKGNKGVTFKNS